MWMRRPTWMYLPSQTSPLNDFQAKASGSGTRDDADGAGGELDRRESGHAAVGASPGAAASGSYHGVDGDHGQAQPIGDSMENEDGGNGIRGHRCKLGATRAQPVTGGGTGAARGDDQTRGPTDGPGALGPAVMCREQRRLDRLNANLARSFADHAERVERKRARGECDEQRLTATERLAAIRRRLRGRSVAPSASGGDAHADGNTLPPLPTDRARDEAVRHDGFEAARRKGLTESPTSSPNPKKTSEVSKMHFVDGEGPTSGCAVPRGPGDVLAAREQMAAFSAWHGRER
jgi:hypothetical protein